MCGHVTMPLGHHKLSVSQSLILKRFWIDFESIYDQIYSPEKKSQASNLVRLHNPQFGPITYLSLIISSITSQFLLLETHLNQKMISSTFISKVCYFAIAGQYYALVMIVLAGSAFYFLYYCFLKWLLKSIFSSVALFVQFECHDWILVYLTLYRLN